MIPERKCARCKKTKPISAFGRSTAEGIQRYCQRCNSQNKTNNYMTTRRERNAEYLKQIRKGLS